MIILYTFIKESYIDKYRSFVGGIIFMVMNESVENYLETILVLNHRLGNVRSIDIANEMNFKKPSVSVAMNAIPLFQAGLSCWGLIPALQQKMHVRLNMMSAPKVLKRSNVT